MVRTLTRSFSFAAIAGMLLAFGTMSRAQEPSPKDDALDSLLKKIEQKDSKPIEKDESRKEASGDKETVPAEAKPSGEVSGKDKEIDSLLEKLGSGGDKPTPDDKPQGGGGGGPTEPMPPGKPGDESKKNDPNPLTGKSKDLDEHLEELTGKKRKKKKGDGQDGSPMSEVIKEMRDVEQRLGKTDTGEETRKKQDQIVKRIDTLIEQMRSTSSKSKGKPRPGKLQPGQEQGQQPSNTAGTTGGNAPFTKPVKPTDRKSIAGGKDAWGHLPPELRQEMENVFREEPLPAREELIRRYYLSLSKKTSTRGE